MKIPVIPGSGYAGPGMTGAGLRAGPLNGPRAFQQDALVQALLADRNLRTGLSGR